MSAAAPAWPPPPAVLCSPGADPLQQTVAARRRVTLAQQQEDTPLLWVWINSCSWSLLPAASMNGLRPSNGWLEAPLGEDMLVGEQVRTSSGLDEAVVDMMLNR